MRLAKYALAFGFALVPFVSRAHADTRTYAVMRNDDRIGTNTIDVESVGRQTTVQTVTHVEVKILFLTVYRFDQTETERWANGHLLAMNSTTDDNGAVHKTEASSSGDGIIVHGDGQEKRISATIIPINLWNTAVLAQDTALDPRDGSLVSVRVADQGEDSLFVQGRQTRTRHYLVTTTFSQDAWYDENHRLVKLQLKASDGSLIRYQLV